MDSHLTCGGKKGRACSMSELAQMELMSVGTAELLKPTGSRGVFIAVEDESKS